MASLNEITRPFLTAAITQAATGAMITGVAGTTIRVYALVLSVATTTTVQFKDGATALSGAMTLTAGIPLALEYFPDMRPLYVCSAGADFTLTLGAAIQTSGTVWYTTQT